MSQKLAIVGGGNLGASIALGLVESGICEASDIMVTRRKIEALSPLSEKGILVSDNNKEALAFADYVIFAVKPFQIKEILLSLRSDLDPERHIVISTVAGVWMADLLSVLGADFPVCRIMPNTAIAIRESMTGICFQNASQNQQEYVVHLFDHLGRSLVIDEKLMDAMTVLGSCGTAFALRFIRANIQAGIEIGISAKDASTIVEQTVKGAAALLQINQVHPEAEIDKVTTPKGCTIVGLNEMEHHGLSSAIMKGIVTSFDKISH